MNALVGYTGFVGSNLYASGSFDAAYNSKNIERSYGTEPELLVYAGLRAEKYLADRAPEQDMAQILQAEDNIRRIAPKRLVLISTIDVFRDPRGVDEESVIDGEGLRPYGRNRYQLESWVRARYPDALIVRLPALFGRNIKKNFIYDYIHLIPFMLRRDKFEELSAADPELRRYYVLQDNGFYRVNISEEDKGPLKERFRALGFSALNFTDSRSQFQFYDLSRLWQDIQTALGAGIRLWHPAVEPVSAAEVYQYLTGERFVNELEGTPARYDFRTVHAGLFGGSGGYIYGKDRVLRGIEHFVQHENDG